MEYSVRAFGQQRAHGMRKFRYAVEIELMLNADIQTYESHFRLQFMALDTNESNGQPVIESAM
jgi:cell division FtsZ-interacting protein ZapD